LTLAETGKSEMPVNRVEPSGEGLVALEKGGKDEKNSNLALRTLFQGVPS
jgi:hypothetical protein